MSRQLTIRGVSEQLARALQKLSEARGRSVNSTVIEVLETALGVDRRRERLQRYATWTDADADDLEQALKLQRQIDHALWR